MERAKGGALHLNKFESPYPRMHCVKFGEISPAVLKKKMFKNCQCFFNCYFVIISPWIKVETFIWKNWSPHHPVLQVWLKFDQWFWWRRFVNFVNVFSLFHYKGLSFEQTWIPFTKGCSVPSLLEIGSVVLEKKIF